MANQCWEVFVRHRLTACPYDHWPHGGEGIKYTHAFRFMWNPPALDVNVNQPTASKVAIRGSKVKHIRITMGCAFHPTTIAAMVAVDGNTSSPNDEHSLGILRDDRQSGRSDAEECVLRHPRNSKRPHFRLSCGFLAA